MLQPICLKLCNITFIIGFFLFPRKLKTTFLNVLQASSTFPLKLQSVTKVSGTVKILVFFFFPQIFDGKYHIFSQIINKGLHHTTIK